MNILGNAVPLIPIAEQLMPEWLDPDVRDGDLCGFPNPRKLIPATDCLAVLPFMQRCRLREGWR